MTALRRAVLYLIRKKGRSILLLIVVFVMGSSIQVGMSLKAGADQEAENVRRSMGSTFRITVNTNNPANYEEKIINGIKHDIYAGPLLYQEDIDAIMGVEGVTDYIIDTSFYVWVDLELRPGLYAYSCEEYLMASPEEQKEIDESLWVIGGMDSRFLHKQVVDYIACGNGELQGNFRVGALEITEGRNLQNGDEYKAVISANLAERNGLEVGDTFTMAAREGIYRQVEDLFKILGEPIEVTIVGLFNVNFEQDVDEINGFVISGESDFLENLIYIDMKAGGQIRASLGQDPDAMETYGTFTFFVEDPEDLERVMEEAAEINNIGENFNIEKDDTSYRAIVRPLEQIGIYTTVTMGIIVIGSLVILSLVFTMWMRSREREMGILLSIGLTKRSITGQFVLESMIVVVIGLILAMALSGVMIDGAGELANSLATPKETGEVFEMHAWEPVAYRVSSGEINVEYSLTVWTVLGMVLGTGAVTAGSVILAARRTMKAKPKEILSSLR